MKDENYYLECNDDNESHEPHAIPVLNRNVSLTEKILITWLEYRTPDRRYPGSISDDTHF